MNQREKIMAGITGLVAVVGVAVLFMPQDDGSTGGGAFTGDPDAIEETFRSNYEQLAEGPQIRIEFNKFNTRLPERAEDRTAEATFSDEIARLLKDRGWTRPRIRAARQSFIDDVDDYYFIDLELDVEGELRALTDLLQDLHKENILIKTFRIGKPRPDDDMAELNILVSRLAKMDADMQRAINKRRSR